MNGHQFHQHYNLNIKHNISIIYIYITFIVTQIMTVIFIHSFIHSFKYKAQDFNYTYIYIY